MKTLIAMTTLVVVLGVLYIGISHSESSRPGVGEAALDFTLVDLDGKNHSVSDYRGSVVVLEWTDYGCSFVKKHYDSGNIPNLQEASIARDVVWLSVASGKSADADELKSHGYAAKSRCTAVLLDEDGKVGKSYGARTTPHIFIIDRAGNLAYSGGVDSIRSSRISDIKEAEAYVAKALNAVFDDKPVSDAVTRPYGCPIRY